MQFEKLFYPRAVAIIGINEKPYGGGYFLRVLTELDFEKPIYLVNPRLEG
jgi:acyl-CoA synthetase (NDP forming)